MSRIKLDNVDLAWLRMHQVKNPMMITVIVQLSGQTSYDAMVTLVNELFTRYRRFRNV
jgi:endonuclease III